ncbi:hypothetical protein ACIGXM_31570 [Kitasatospora sp. NPDC052896]|uniref:hypothetical protein n=1 Tax=Kitasatospora sp. NPDC052896 TaxID=3364061 RepID=UPI0037C80283
MFENDPMPEPLRRAIRDGETGSTWHFIAQQRVCRKATGEEERPATEAQTVLQAFRYPHADDPRAFDQLPAAIGDKARHIAAILEEQPAYT